VETFDSREKQSISAKEQSIEYIYAVSQERRPNISNLVCGFWTPERTNMTHIVLTFDKRTKVLKNAVI
jgi:hypothetical protein